MEDFNYKSADRVIDGKNSHATMPGLINAHTHSALTLCRGTANDLPEIEYMPKGLSIFANHLKPEDFVLGTKLAVLEGLKNGTTTFTEYGIGLLGLVKKIFLPFKARVVATEMISELSFNEEKKPNELYTFYHYVGTNALRRANKLYKEFKNNELVNVMYGPNALDMVSMELIKSIKNQATEKGIKMHMHIAQGGRERQQITMRYGKDMTAVKLLKKNDLLDSTLIAAHIHDTTEEERAQMVKNGVKMVGCPSSISKIDGIVPPLASYVNLGGKAALGTDEAPGTGHHNLFNEIKMASILSKVISKDPTALPPWESIKLATITGAHVLGLEDKIGSLRVGKSADILTFNLHYAHLTPIIHKPFKNIIANLIYSSKGNEVDNVIIAGKPIIIDGKFLHVDEDSIINDANKRAQDLFEDITEDWLKIDSKMVSYHKKGFI
jgi:5-methylthioadenosine/S-adenosylhomocysteine deaminase